MTWGGVTLKPRSARARNRNDRSVNDEDVA